MIFAHSSHLTVFLTVSRYQNCSVTQMYTFFVVFNTHKILNAMTPNRKENNKNP